MNNMDLEYEMFCYQCEQTANGKGCTKQGVCGKTANDDFFTRKVVILISSLENGKNWGYNKEKNRRRGTNAMNCHAKKFAVQKKISAEEIRALRKELGFTQRDFAELLGCSKATVERLEKDGSSTQGPMVLLMKLLKRDTDYIKTLEIPQKELPVRMWYMYKDIPCTLIDVDELKKIVRIRNYTDNVMFTAFGVKEKPNIEDYRDFLESRCFPRTRDKMKIALRDLGIPFYDPYLIIEKTQGRMAEDDFWIKIEE